MMEKDSIVRLNEAIQINSAITLLQRKTWNVLLANAFDKLLDEEIHVMDLSELRSILGLNGRNDERLRQLLVELNTCQIEWNILGKDKSAEWVTTTFLAGAEIKNGRVYYGYFKDLKEKLYSPRMYARINLSMQNKFSSKYALALYELFVDYFDVSRNYGETPWISVPIFRKLMGIADDEYPRFYDLKKRAITLAVDEIHGMPDINFLIEDCYKTHGRTVKKIKFKIWPKNVVKLLPTDSSYGD